MYRHAANDHAWEEITHTLNARTGKAFSKRQVIRKFAPLQWWYRAVTGVRRYGHFGNVHPVPFPDRLFHDLPQQETDAWLKQFSACPFCDSTNIFCSHYVW